MLWNWFRSLNDTVAFYEPTLADLRQVVSFDLAPDIEHHHFGVSSYGREYKAVPCFSEKFKPYFGLVDLTMLESGGAGLYEYLNCLLNYGAGRGKHVVVKDLNMRFRVKWLKKRFQDARIILLRRRIRDAWRSNLRVLRKHYKNADSLVDFGEQWLTAHRVGLASAFPFIGYARQRDPYAAYFMINTLANGYAAYYADMVVEYEGLIRAGDGDLIGSIEALCDISQGELLKVAKRSMVVKQKTNSSENEQYNDEYFDDVESKCLEAMRTHGLANLIDNKPNMAVIEACESKFASYGGVASPDSRELIMALASQAMDNRYLALEKEGQIKILDAACKERLDVIHKLEQALKR